MSLRKIVSRKLASALAAPLLTIVFPAASAAAALHAPSACELRAENVSTHAAAAMYRQNLPPVTAGGDTRQSISPDSADIAIKVVSRTDAPKVSVFNIEQAIRPVTVKAEKGATVAVLLAERKIKPDAYSFGLVMDLNPGLVDIEKLYEGQEIVIPTINAKAINVTHFQVERYDIAAAYSSHLKLKTNVETKLKPYVAEITSSTPQGGEYGVKFANTSARNLRLIEEIRRLPVNSDTLRSVESQAEIFASVLEIARDQGYVDEELADMAWEVHATLAYVAANARAKENIPNVDVLAQVLGLSNPPEYPVRVHCREAGGFRVARKNKQDPYVATETFNAVSSIASGKLQDGVRYFFWLVREDKGERISDAVPQFIKRSPQICPEKYRENYQYCFELQPKK